MQKSILVVLLLAAFASTAFAAKIEIEIKKDVSDKQIEEESVAPKKPSPIAKKPFKPINKNEEEPIKEEVIVEDPIIEQKPSPNAKKPIVPIIKDAINNLKPNESVDEVDESSDDVNSVDDIEDMENEPIEPILVLPTPQGPKVVAPNSNKKMH